MLAAVGAAGVEELFRDIPQVLRETATPNLPGPLTEPELLAHMQRLASANASAEDLTCFAGGGLYDRFIPSIISAVVGRPEFLTGYTQYQPEASQGMLQALFEYQSMVCELTDMPMANASLYDGASALGEAILLAAGERQRSRALVSRALSPAARRVAQTYCSAMGIETVEIPYVPDTGRTDLQALRAAVSADVCCVALQQPNHFGVLEDMEAAAGMAHDAGALFVASVEPVSLALLRPPGAYGADIAIGEGQALGLPMGYGGPLLGLFACREEMMRRVPGRIVGQTGDADGNLAYCLTLQAREQHIRREKATSNICTSESLCALAAAVYLAALGPVGLREVAEQSAHKAHYLADRLQDGGVARLRFAAPFLNEFVLATDEAGEDTVARLADRGYLVGPALGREYPELADCLLVAVTEQRTREEFDGLVGALSS
jgi:glycine dehydrogenase subunit 1